ncbi:diguanylate cyclase [Planctomycetota bacterium]
MKLVSLKRMDFRLGSTTHIAFALGMWAATVLLGLRMFGILNDDVRSILRSRVKRCDSMAFACAEFIRRNEPESVRNVLRYHVDHSKEIIAAKCEFGGRDVYRSQHHDDKQWQGVDTASLTCIRIPINSKLPTAAKGDSTGKSGSVDITFSPPVGSGIAGFFSRKSILVTIMASSLNLLGFMFITRRCFRDFDPSKVVPDRVRSAFDTMAEMVLVLDENNHVALTNRSFNDCVKVDGVQGMHVDLLPWGIPDSAKFSDLMERMLAGDADDGAISLVMHDGKTRTLKPNVSAIVDEAGSRRGYLVSLDDITTLEEKTIALQSALRDLQSTQLEIEQRNEQLEFFATRDPMTGCLNRRAFFEKMDEFWKTRTRYRHPLSCVMIDVDHFKSVNDNHGHGIGDEVLIKIATTLLETSRETDCVCRYGGEEFCVVLPHVDIEGVAMASERFRRAIAALEIDRLTVTASFGCSSVEFGADSPAAMIDQADQALYAAKENGRNRVVRFDQIANVECESNVNVTRTDQSRAVSFPVEPNGDLSDRSIDRLFAAVEL